MLTRRRFLEAGGLGVLAAASLPLWLAPRGARAATGAKSPLLVVLFLRGGADGLHLVPPIGDPDYARARGSLALAKTLPFADGFGLHPALEPLSTLLQRGELAAVHAAGSADRSRSHFEAQDRMELGAPASRAAVGWLARALSGQPVESPFAALALSDALPLALHGSGAFAIGDPHRFGLAEASSEERAALAARYAATSADPLAEAGRRALAAIAEFERRTGVSAAAASGAARGRQRRPDPPLPERVRQLLDLCSAGLPVTAVALECHGWDTHQRQGAETGAMARPMQELAGGLAGLAEGLRGKRDWLAVAMTEFGRTVRPNGSQGSDHGHGSVMLIAGPRVRAGVHGRWPGLGAAALHEGRDLAVATDYRQVLHEVVSAHLGAAPPADTFPALSAQPLSIIA